MIWPVIRKWERMPFSYDGNDCCQFVGECIEAVTGENPAAEFFYGSEAEAYELIDSYGSLYGLLTDVFGEPDGCANEYGLALTECRGREMAGFVWGDKLIVKTAGGLTDWPVSRAVAVWSLECRQ